MLMIKLRGTVMQVPLGYHEAGVEGPQSRGWSPDKAGEVSGRTFSHSRDCAAVGGGVLCYQTQLRIPQAFARRSPGFLKHGNSPHLLGSV